MTVSLLIYAWAAQSESQRHGEPKTTASQHAVERQRSLRGRVECELWGMSSMRLNLASLSAGAAEVTVAVAGCCCSVSGGLLACNKLRACTLCPSCECLIYRSVEMFMNMSWILQTHLFKGDLGRVDDVGAIPPVAGVLLVPEDEGDVGGGAVGRLVPLSGEGDPGPCSPAFLHHHVQHLLLRPQAMAFWAQAAPGDLHVLCAAVHDLLQGHWQVVHHLFALTPAGSTIVTGEPVNVAEGEPPEGVEQIVLALKVGAKEEIKVVCEGSMGVAVEMVVERFALSCRNPIFKA